MIGKSEHNLGEGFVAQQVFIINWIMLQFKICSASLPVRKMPKHRLKKKQRLWIDWHQLCLLWKSESKLSCGTYISQSFVDNFYRSYVIQKLEKNYEKLESNFVYKSYFSFLVDFFSVIFTLFFFIMSMLFDGTLILIFISAQQFISSCEPVFLLFNFVDCLHATNMRVYLN